jgi:hypothetical protein
MFGAELDFTSLLQIANGPRWPRAGRFLFSFNSPVIFQGTAALRAAGNEVLLFRPSFIKDKIVK